MFSCSVPKDESELLQGGAVGLQCNESSHCVGLSAAEGTDGDSSVWLTCTGPKMMLACRVKQLRVVFFLPVMVKEGILCSDLLKSVERFPLLSQTTKPQMLTTRGSMSVFPLRNSVKLQTPFRLISFPSKSFSLYAVAAEFVHRRSSVCTSAMPVVSVGRMSSGCSLLFHPKLWSMQCQFSGL